MTNLAKWAWVILLCTLYFGPWTLALAAGSAAAALIVLWLKPK